MLRQGQSPAKTSHCCGKNGKALQRAPSSPCQVHLLHWGEKAAWMEGAYICQATLCNLLLCLVATGGPEETVEEGRYHSSSEAPCRLHCKDLWKLFSMNLEFRF